MVRPNKKPVGKKGTTKPPPKSKETQGRKGAAASNDATKAVDADQKAKVNADRKSHEIYMLKKTALKSRIDNIRCCHKDICHQKELMAGYLQMQDTEQLHCFLHTSETATGLLKIWDDHLSEAFGCVMGKKSNGQPKNPKDEKWLKGHIFAEIVAKPPRIPIEVLKSSLPLDKSNYPETSKLRGLVSWVVTMYQVMLANPAHYPDFKDPNKTTVLAGYPVEDWNRAYQTLRAYHRVHTDAGSSNVNEDSNRRPKNAAQEPTMLTDEDITSLKLDMGDTGAQILRRQSKRLLEESEPDDGTSSEEDVGDMNAKVTTISAKLAKVTASSSCRLSKTDESNIRPAISVDEQRTVCEIIGKRARQLYPGPEVDLAPPNEVEEPAMPEGAADHKQRAAVEELLGDPEDVTDQMRADFWQQQLAMNAISSEPPSYSKSCEILNLDPTRPAIRLGKPVPISKGKNVLSPEQEAKDRDLMKDDIVLYPWQVQGVAWLKGMEESKLKAALLADDMGLGKTITTIAFMLLMPVPDVPTSAPASLSTAVDDAVLDPLEVLRNRKHKPTLFTFPSNAQSVWKDELNDNFPHVTVKYWFGSRNTGAITTRDKTLKSSPTAVIRYVQGLPDEPWVRHVAVLTTLQTLRDRSVYSSTRAEEAERLKSRLRAKKVNVAPNDKNKDKGDEDEYDEDEGDEDEEPQGDETQEAKEVDLTETERSDFKSFLTGIFGRVIVVEAHSIKSVQSLSNRAVELLGATSLILISGTPMINRPIDYLGLLCLVFKKSLKKGSDPTLKEYKADNEAHAAGTNLTAVNDDGYFHLLNPISFTRLMSPRAGEPVDTGTASIVIPPVFRRFQLRRTAAHEVEVDGVRQRIGASMKPYTVHTVELAMSDIQSQEYFAAHNHCAWKMGLGQDEATEENLIDIEKHRRLCHAILNPQLEKLARNCRVKEINKWYEKYNDHGATFLFKKTRPAPLLPPYSDRSDMAVYMSMLSPKLQWLAKYCSEIVNSRGRKLLIFCNWPMTVFNVEAFLVNLNFDVLSIRSAHKASERDTARGYFNDPNHPAKIMVTSIQVSGASVNMHLACSDCVFVDAPGSCGQMLQAMCRLFRLGQKRIGHVIILTVDHTYDQAIQARAANKMMAQIAGAGGITATETERNEYTRTHAEYGMMKESEIDSMVINDKCVSLYMGLCGQRSSRHEWTDIYDIRAKDALDVESRWRLSQGLSMKKPSGFEDPPAGYKSSIDFKKSRFQTTMEKREKAQKKAEKATGKGQTKRNTRSTKAQEVAKEAEEAQASSNAKAEEASASSNAKAEEAQASSNAKAEEAQASTNAKAEEAQASTNAKAKAKGPKAPNKQPRSKEPGKTAKPKPPGPGSSDAESNVEDRVPTPPASGRKPRAKKPKTATKEPKAVGKRKEAPTGKPKAPAKRTKLSEPKVTSDDDRD